MTCIWRPPLYGGHFCQVPRVAAIDRFDCIYIYIYIYIYVCVCVYIYIYIYIYTHTHTHQLWSTGLNNKLFNRSTMRDRSNDASHHEWMLYHGATSHCLRRYMVVVESLSDVAMVNCYFFLQVYDGYADDPRNTDNAWLETKVFSYHDEDGSILRHFSLRVKHLAYFFCLSTKGSFHKAILATVDLRYLQLILATVDLSYS